MEVSELTKFPCQCGARLKAPAAAAGKRVKCPKCGQVNTVPAATRQEEAAGGGFDINSTLEALAKHERSAAAVEQPASSRGIRCANCGAMMSAEARLCTQCGYDTRTGRKLKAASAKQAAAAAAVRQVATGAGRFLLGTGLCAAGAVVGAVIWCVVAVATGYELGWIAWGLGGLAGLGMRLGYREENARAGAVATVIAVGGIFLGKILVFAFVIYAAVTGNTSNIEILRANVAINLADEWLDDQGIYMPDEREEKWPAALLAVQPRVAAMTDDQIRAKAEEYRALEEAAALSYGDDETSQTVYVLAQHHADRKADREGLGYADPKRRIYLRDEHKRFQDMTTEQLVEAKAEMEAWEGGGKWSEPGYAREYLIYHSVDETWMESDGISYGDLKGRTWDDLYTSAAANADEMTPEEQLAKAKEMDFAESLEIDRSVVAMHRAMLRDMDAGAQYAEDGDEAESEYWEEEFEKVKQLSPEELKAEADRIQAWEEGGKWQDARYVRYLVISETFDERWAEWSDREEAEKEDGGPPAGPEPDWTELYPQIAAEVDKLTTEQQLAAHKALEEKAERRSKAFIEELAAEQAAAEEQEMQEFKEEMTAGFFSVMFGPLDVLFFLFGAITAFRIASGGQ